MRFVSGVACQKFRRIGDGHVINLTLHWAKEMVVEVRDMDCLVNYQAKNLACYGVVIGKCLANGGEGLGTKGWVIPLPVHKQVCQSQEKLRHRGLNHTCQRENQVPG